jgi:uncharacterized coiled-coil protein SlyX
VDLAEAGRQREDAAGRAVEVAEGLADQVASSNRTVSRLESRLKTLYGIAQGFAQEREEGGEVAHGLEAELRLVRGELDMAQAERDEAAREASGAQEGLASQLADYQSTIDRMGSRLKALYGVTSGFAQDRESSAAVRVELERELKLARSDVDLATTEREGALEEAKAVTEGLADQAAEQEGTIAFLQSRLRALHAAVAEAADQATVEAAEEQAREQEGLLKAALQEREARWAEEKEALCVEKQALEELCVEIQAEHERAISSELQEADSEAAAVQSQLSCKIKSQAGAISKLEQRLQVRRSSNRVCRPPSRRLTLAPAPPPPPTPTSSSPICSGPLWRGQRPFPRP